MNRDWQHFENGTVPNPSDVARGPQLYDNHLYFNFGGVAAQDPESYMKVICNYTGIISTTAIGNAPIVTGAFHLVPRRFSTLEYPLRIQSFHELNAGQVNGPS